MGIEAESFFEVGEAVPNVESYEVPGRSGGLTYWDGTYANRPITAPSYLLADSLPRDVDKINEWLLSSQRYDRLELSNDPDHFWLARATRGISEQVRADVLTPFAIEFDALPQKYLKAGEMEYKAGKIIRNPTKFTAFPILKIKIEDVVQITIGGRLLQIGSVSGEVVIDTETGTATKNGENVDSKVTFTDDLVLLPGDNEVTISGGTLSYIPRWWTL